MGRERDDMALPWCRRIAIAVEILVTLSCEAPGVGAHFPARDTSRKIRFRSSSWPSERASALRMSAACPTSSAVNRRATAI